tara:strand:- start:216 stop:1046 length:831 start_codon:yes stop_codon:yes gene_type:complete
MKDIINQFYNEGYIGPFKLLDNDECNNILDERCIPLKEYTWYKSIHEKSPLVREVSLKPLILEKIKNILGNDILLWGSHFIHQKPSGQHAWHLDVEYGSWNGLTVWIGLKNLNENTPLSIITKSHLINTAPKELENTKFIDVSDDMSVLNEAKKINPECEIKEFRLKEGEFIIWSGRLWHKTSNDSKTARDSMILQYCTTNNQVKIPENYKYPDTKWSKKKPICFLVSGEDKFNKNIILSKSDIKNGNNLVNKFKTNFIYKPKYKLFNFYREILNK